MSLAVSLWKYAKIYHLQVVKLIILINKQWLLLLNGRIDLFLTCADKWIVLPVLISLFVWRHHRRKPIKKTGWFCSTHIM